MRGAVTCDISRSMCTDNDVEMLSYLWYIIVDCTRSKEEEKKRTQIRLKDV